MNADKFDEFWELAKKMASQDETILGFRKLWEQTREQCSDLERKLDSEIKFLR